MPEDGARYLETKFPLIEEGDVTWVVAEAHQLEARGIRFSGWARPGAEETLNMDRTDKSCLQSGMRPARPKDTVETRGDADNRALCI